MNKEQLIQQLKYTKEKHKNDKLFTFDTDISAMCSDVLDVLSRCVEIPDNATNGDIMKAIFDIVEDEHQDKGTINLYFFDLDIAIVVSLDWWNALYERN